MELLLLFRDKQKGKQLGIRSLQRLLVWIKLNIANLIMDHKKVGVGKTPFGDHLVQLAFTSASAISVGKFPVEGLLCDFYKYLLVRKMLFASGVELANSASIRRIASIR